MRRLLLLVLVLPTAASAADIDARFKDGDTLIVQQRQMFFLDARDSVSEEPLTWEVNPNIAQIKDVTMEYANPGGGKPDHSIMFVKGELPEGSYIFTAAARRKSDPKDVKTAKKIVIVWGKAPGIAPPIPGASVPPIKLSSLVVPHAKIGGKDFVIPGSDLVLDGGESQSVSPDGLIWSVDPMIPYTLLPSEGVTKGSRILIERIPPGTYTFTLTAKGTDSGDGKPILANSTTKVVTVATQDPNLANRVACQEVPNFTGPLVASIIVGPGHQNLARKVKLAGTNARRSEKLFNFTYNTYDLTSPEVYQKNLWWYIAGHCDTSGKVWPKIDGPVLIIQDWRGYVISAEKAPETEEGVIAKIVEIRLR